MKKSTQKKCLHCENEFFAQRSSKKYCSDNCKQMAYFKRNGLVLSGTNEIIVKEFYANGTVKDDKQNLNVKYDNETLSVKDANQNKEPELFNVKYSTQTQEELNDIEETVAKHLENITSQFNQAIEKLRQEFNVKYENLNSQLCFTQNGFTLRPNLKDNNPLSEKISCLELLDDTGEKLEEQEDIETQDEYTWIESKFLKQTEKHCSQSEAAIHLQNPQRYYNIDDFIKAGWVNVRLLCLVKSLIHIGNYESIDRYTLFCLSDAFIRLSNSTKYNSLPLNYPYGRFIRDYSEQLKTIARKNQHSEKIKVKINLDKKVFLVSVNYILSQHYPEIKFSELNFYEEEILRDKTQEEQQLQSRPIHTRKNLQSCYEKIKKSKPLKLVA